MTSNPFGMSDEFRLEIRCPKTLADGMLKLILANHWDCGASIGHFVPHKDISIIFLPQVYFGSISHNEAINAIKPITRLAGIDISFRNGIIWATLN